MKRGTGHGISNSSEEVANNIFWTTNIFLQTNDVLLK